MRIISAVLFVLLVCASISGLNDTTSVAIYSTLRQFGCTGRPTRTYRDCGVCHAYPPTFDTVKVDIGRYGQTATIYGSTTCISSPTTFSQSGCPLLKEVIFGETLALTGAAVKIQCGAVSLFRSPRGIANNTPANCSGDPFKSLRCGVCHSLVSGLDSGYDHSINFWLPPGSNTKATLYFNSDCDEGRSSLIAKKITTTQCVKLPILGTEAIVVAMKFDCV